MSRSFVTLQQSFDALLATIPNFNSYIFANENTNAQIAQISNPAGSIILRTSWLSKKAESLTIGAAIVQDGGIYVVDVIGKMNNGYAATKSVGDAICNVFYPGLTFAAGDSNVVIESSAPSQNITMGSWIMSGFYCNQIFIEWYALTNG